MSPHKVNTCIFNFSHNSCHPETWHLFPYLVIQKKVHVSISSLPEKGQNSLSSHVSKKGRQPNHNFSKQMLFIQ